MHHEWTYSVAEGSMIPGTGQNVVVRCNIDVPGDVGLGT